MKLIEIITPSANADTIAAIATQQKVDDFRQWPADSSGQQSMRMLLSDDKLQAVLDQLETIMGSGTDSRIVVVPVEVTLPKPPEEERKKEDEALASRDALYNSAEKNALLDLNFAVLVVLSTVVAAIGLLEDNVAIVIGAMVIAPLLGPNLAFGLGTALGDIRLMRKASVSLVTGLALAVLLSMAIGVLWPLQQVSGELLLRTDVGLDSVALALASGAAAALSLTTGLSSVLVGVMVAVALLPPAATLGLLVGQGRTELAAGAGLLLAVNIVSVNLACKLVFLVKGIAPRTWWEQQKARKAMRTYIAMWIITLALLVLAIYVRRQLS